MLWTNTSNLSDIGQIFLLLLPADTIILLSDHMSTKAGDLTTCCFEHTCKHRDSCGFTCTVVTKQSKDFTFSHVQRDMVNRCEIVDSFFTSVSILQQFKLLYQIVDSKNVVVVLWLLIVGWSLWSSWNQVLILCSFKIEGV